MLSTIFAQSTPVGRSALSILRIAGPDALKIMRELAPGQSFKPRRAQLAKLYKPESTSVLDEALVLYFKGPKSYTGEDIVELHLHGSPAVSRAVHTAINSTRLARHAEPGEFTRRAFQNRRMDLAQVEGIRDLLAAETELQRQSSIGGATGQISDQFEKWRTQIIECSAMLTAAIDFAEDHGLENTIHRVKADADKIKEEVSHTLVMESACSEIVKTGIRVVLLGEPNAGKSSLTNALARRAASIVSDVPGTTRDVLEVSLEIGNHKIVLYDTAGIRTTQDKVETLGIERARHVLDSAHIVLALIPSPSYEKDLYSNIQGAQEVFDEANRLEAAGKRVIRIRSKADLAQNPNVRTSADELWVSSTTGEGLDSLVADITCEANNLMGDANFDPNTLMMGAGISSRARSLLETEVLPGLDACLTLIDTDIVLAAAELQRAADGIGMITGRGISVHEVLDVVFGEFCIGK